MLKLPHTNDIVLCKYELFAPNPPHTKTYPIPKPPHNKSEQILFIPNPAHTKTSSYQKTSPYKTRFDHTKFSSYQIQLIPNSTHLKTSSYQSPLIQNSSYFNFSSYRLFFLGSIAQFFIQIYANVSSVHKLNKLGKFW